MLKNNQGLSAVMDDFYHDKFHTTASQEPGHLPSVMNKEIQIHANKPKGEANGCLSESSCASDEEPSSPADHEGRLAVVPSGTGSGKTHWAVVKGIEKCAQDPNALVGILVSQTAHRDDIKNLIKDNIDNCTIAPSQWLVHGTKNNADLLFLSLPGRENLICQMIEQRAGGSWSDKLDILKEFFLRLSHITQDVENGWLTEKDISKKAAFLLKDAPFKARSKPIENLISKACKALSKSLDANADLLTGKHAKAKDKEKEEAIEELSRLRGDLRRLLYEKIFAQIKKPKPDQPQIYHDIYRKKIDLLKKILRYALIEAVKTAPSLSGADLFLSLFSDECLSLVNLFAATHAKSMYPFFWAGESAPTLLENVRLKKGAYLVIDEIDEFYVTAENNLIDQAQKNALDILKTLRIMETVLTPREAHSPLGKELMSAGGCCEKKKKILDEWKAPYGPIGACRNTMATARILSGLEHHTQMEAFLGAQKSPYLVAGRDERNALCPLWLIGDPDKAGSLLIAHPATTSLPDGWQRKYLSDIIWEAYCCIRDMLKEEACADLPIRFATGLLMLEEQSNIPYTKLLDYVDIWLNKKGEVDYKWKSKNPDPQDIYANIKGILNKTSQELINDLSANKADASHMDDIFKKAKESAFKDGLLNNLYSSKGDGANAANIRQLEQMYEDIVNALRNGYPLDRIPWNVDVSPCLEKRLIAYITKFDGITNLASSGSFEPDEIKMERSPEDLLCALIERGVNILALSATGKVDSARNFLWDLIESVHPRTVVPASRIKKQLEEERADRERHLTQRNFNFQKDVRPENDDDEIAQLIKKATLNMDGAGDLISKLLYSSQEDNPARYWERLRTFVVTYRKFIEGGKPDQQNYVNGALFFASKKPPESLEDGDPYCLPVLKRIAQLLIDEGEAANSISKAEAEELRQNPFEILDNKPVSSADSPAFRFEDGDSQAANDLQKKLDKANNRYVNKGIRTFFITTYASYAAGFNWKIPLIPSVVNAKRLLEINDRSYGKEDLSPNLTGLCWPTNYLPHSDQNPKKEMNKEENAKLLLQKAVVGNNLRIRGEFNEEYLLRYIQGLFNPARKNMASVIRWAIARAVQAVGRMERCNLRLPLTQTVFGFQWKIHTENYAKTLFAEDTFIGATTQTQMVVDCLLCDVVDLYAATHADTSALNLQMQEADRVYNYRFPPQSGNPTQREEQARLSDLFLNQGRLHPSADEYAALPPELQGLYSLVDAKNDTEVYVQPGQIHYRYNEYGYEYAIIKADGSWTKQWQNYIKYKKPNKKKGSIPAISPLLVPHESVWRVLDAYNLTGLRQIFGDYNASRTKIQHKGKELLLLPRLVAALEKYPLFADASRHLKKPVLKQEPFYTLSFEALMKVRGYIAEIFFKEVLLPWINDAYAEDYNIKLLLEEVDPKDERYEKFDFYVYAKNRKDIQVGVDAKNFSRMRNIEEAKKWGEKYAQRADDLNLEKGLLLQPLPFSRDFPDNRDWDAWRRSVSVTARDRVIAYGPLLDRNYQGCKDQFDAFCEKLSALLIPNFKSSR